jgi:hypothetical protein
VDEQRTFSNAPRTYQGNALAISEQAQSFTALSISAVEISRLPNRASMKEWIVQFHVCYFSAYY